MAPPSEKASGHQTLDTPRETARDPIYAKVTEEPCEVTTGNLGTTPLMADLMSGPNSPLAKGFLMAQWRAIPVDRIFGEHHDLSDSCVQTELHNTLQGADFIWAALDCSTKSRCRQIPSKTPGRSLPPAPAQ